jgi:hypothetical protein
VDIGSILIKKITSTLSPEENRFFEEWVNASLKNRNLYEFFLKRYQNGEELPNVDEINIDEAWKVVLEKTGVETKPPYRKNYARLVLKYAAVITVLFGLGSLYFLLQNPKANTPNIEDAITLKLDNGEIKIISPESSQTINDDKGEVLVVQKGVVLDYSKAHSNDEVDSGKLVYNELTVPYGKRFGIVLSDGTKVHLNAGSFLRYPIQFSKDGNRQVSIVGEGYFEVIKDSLRPFIVSAGNMNLRVLGTTFNISSYPEDKDINTVLVEGSVGLYGKKEKFNEIHSPVLLKPGYKASWARSDKNIKFEKVDTSIYTSWIEGKLVLKKLPFTNIVEKLQRHYKVTIVNNYAKLDHQVFTATFDKETIKEVLDSFGEDTPFDYTVEGNHITINKPKNNMPMKK